MVKSTPGPLLTVRTALVLLLAILVGLATGGLVFFSDHHSLAHAVLSGGAAAGGALMLFHNLIGS
jgi:hypothetical protein